MRNISNILGKISFGTAIVSILLCINYFAKILPFIHLSSFVLFIPLYVSPFALILAIFSLVKHKNNWAIFGALLNGLIFALEIIFIIIGASFLR